MDRDGLRNDEWDRIKDLLPGREGHVGGTAPDNRLFVDAVLYRYRTGIPWAIWRPILVRGKACTKAIWLYLRLPPQPARPSADGYVADTSSLSDLTQRR